MAAEIKKAETDVAQVRTRRERDQQRLDTGAVTSAKDLESLQREVVSLDRRITTLEDAELEVMERLEAAQAEQRRLEQEVATSTPRWPASGARATAPCSPSPPRSTEISDERKRAAATLPVSCSRSTSGYAPSTTGWESGRCVQRRCEACRLELNAADLRELAAMDDDEVLRCPECNRLLVRTPESGL